MCYLNIFCENSDIRSDLRDLLLAKDVLLVFHPITVGLILGKL